MYRLVILSVFCCLLHLNGMTQTSGNAAANGAKKKITVKLTTSFSGFKDSATLGVNELKAIIAQPLVVTDDKGNPLSISNFQVAYTRQIISEDEATGKKFLSTQLVTALFTSPTLSSIWIKTIKSDLLPKEELLFYDIVAKDKKGLAYYAPNLKIRTK